MIRLVHYKIDDVLVADEGLLVLFGVAVCLLVLL